MTRQNLNLWHPLATLCGFVLSLFFALFVGAYFLIHGQFILSFVFSILAGTRFRALGNLMHECVHGSLFPNNQSNRFFGFILSLLLWCPYINYCHDHFSHHRYLGDPTKDRDLMRMPLCWWQAPNPIEFWHLIFKFRFLRVWIMNSEWQPFSKQESNLEKVMRASFVVVFLASLFNSQLLFHVPAFALFTFLVPYQIHKYICDLYDHGGLMHLGSDSDMASDHPIKSRNHPIKSAQFVGSKAFDGLLNGLFLPRNDGYHQSHHFKPKQKASKATKDICFPMDPA